MIDVLYVKAGEAPMMKRIEPELAEFQKLVGGYIEAIYPREGIALVCNEEGKLRGLPPNRYLRDRDGEIVGHIAGDFVVCGVDGDELTSVPPERVEGLREMFRRPIDPAVAEGLRRAYSTPFFSAEA